MHILITLLCIILAYLGLDPLALRAIARWIGGAR